MKTSQPDNTVSTVTDIVDIDPDARSERSQLGCD